MFQHAEPELEIRALGFRILWPQHLLLFSVSACLSWLIGRDRLQPRAQDPFPQHRERTGAPDGFLSWYPAEGGPLEEGEEEEEGGGAVIETILECLCGCMRQLRVHLIGQCALRAPLIGLRDRLEVFDARLLCWTCTQNKWMVGSLLSIKTHESALSDCLVAAVSVSWSV